MQPTSADGLWAVNDEMEEIARRLLTPELSPLEPLMRDGYEAGVEAPTIPSAGKPERGSEAALFLKRSLVDFRAMWVLLRNGYTSPAASVAASLWEHSLTVVALLSHTVEQRPLRDNGDTPWSPVDLAATLRRDTTDARPMNAYAAYKWLCKIKHPTLRSTVHDSRATAVPSGEYVVMSLPDTRAEDLPAKRMIALLSVARIAYAAEEFSEAGTPKKDTSQYTAFRDRLRRINEGAAKHFGTDPLPFHLQPGEIPLSLRPA